METFRRVTPLVEAVSLDEAFLDVRGSAKRLGSPLEIAERLRALVHDEQGITCSVGVASTVSVAKLASRRAKPDGVVVVPPEAITSFLHPLDVGELYGVGEKTQATCCTASAWSPSATSRTPRCAPSSARSAPASAATCTSWPGAPTGASSPRASTGRSDPDKSMGAQETFGRDIDDRDVICRELLRLTAKVTRRMRAGGVAGRTVTITVRFADFTTITRSRTIPEATDVHPGGVPHRGLRLYDALGLQRARLRLVGVRVEGLVPREHRAPAAGPRRARARLVRRRPGRRPRPVPVRGRRDPPRQPSRPDDNLPEPATERRRPCLDWPKQRSRVGSRPHPTGRQPCHSPRRSCDCSSRWSAPSSRRTPSSPPPCAARPCASSARRRAILAGVVFVGGIVVLMTGAIKALPVVGIARLRGHARLRHRRPHRDPRPARRPGRRGPASAGRPCCQPRRLHRHRRRPFRQDPPPAAPRAAPPSWTAWRSAGAVVARTTASEHKARGAAPPGFVVSTRNLAWAS